MASQTAESRVQRDASTKSWPRRGRKKKVSASVIRKNGVSTTKAQASFTSCSESENGHSQRKLGPRKLGRGAYTLHADEADT